MAQAKPKKITAGEDSKPFQIPMSGKWRPKPNANQLKEGDFRTLTNMRYTMAPGIKSILGMSKINGTAISSFPFAPTDDTTTIGSKNIWFVTTGFAIPIDTIYFYAYDIVTQLFTLKYSTTEPNDVNADQFNWFEPEIDANTNSTLRTFVLQRNFDATYKTGIDVFVFNVGTLLHRTLIPPDPTSYPTILMSIYGSRWILVDSVGNLHVVNRTYKTGTVSLYDFKSTDNGTTFTAIKVNGSTTLSGTEAPTYIKENSTGTLYSLTSGKLFSSADKGATWSLLGSPSFTTAIRDFNILNDVFFAIDKTTSPADVLIKRSTNGTTWSTVFTIAGKSAYLRSAILHYDSTYYYAVANYRNSTFALTDGYNEVYRSSDGITWSLLTTFIDNSEMAPTQICTAHLMNHDGLLVYTYYYAEVFDSATSTYRMAFWMSQDSGATWTSVMTPFTDLTHSGGQSSPGLIDWKSCPQAILYG